MGEIYNKYKESKGNNWTIKSDPRDKRIEQVEQQVGQLYEALDKISMD